jgi:tetratricopeptide (TPR) repeat protein
MLASSVPAAPQNSSPRAERPSGSEVEGSASRSSDSPIFRVSDNARQELATLQQLLDQKRWSEIIAIVQPLSNGSAETNYIYGTALASLNRWPEARGAFLAGRKLAPRDPRFPEELAGVAFRQKSRSEAKHWLVTALRLNRHDDYANDFLGTLYFLDGNLEAALKYWNRVQKPLLQNVRTETELRTDPVLIDRAFAFAPASLMTRSQYLATQTRLRSLGIFPQFNLQLDARNDGRFDAALNATELNGFGNNKWSALLSTFRGIPFETITPSYSNFKGDAINIDSLFRWDQNKRRISAGISAPLRRDPRWRWRLSTDLRNENWSVENFSSAPVTSLGSLNMRRESAIAEIASYRSGTWDWSTGGEISHRDFRSLAVNSTLPQFLFRDGTQLKHFVRFNYDLVRLPEHRFFISASASVEEARLWSAQDSSFAKFQLSSSQHWFPRPTSNDYEMQSRLSYARTFGDVPFDELFMLGMERDNNLMLRAHVGTKNGLKGSAPLGRNYFLSNWEIDKQLYNAGLFRLTLGPFLDTGKITDPNPALGSRNWLYDTGAQLKLRVLGVGFAFFYGKDLRSGNNTFYVYLLRH